MNRKGPSEFIAKLAASAFNINLDIIEVERNTLVEKLYKPTVN